LFEFSKVISGVDLLIVNGNISLRVHPISWVMGIPYATIYAKFTGYKREGKGVNKKIENLARKFIAENAHKNIFLSKYAEESSDLPEKANEVVFNPVDKWMQEFYNETGREERSPKAPFLFAGRLIEGKGLFVLADALALLDGEVSFQLEVAGEGRDAERFRERTRSLSTIQVDLLGRLDNAALVECYQRARALILPSTTHKEGNPLVVAEALYAGTPVIASNQPPMIESVGDAGIIVKQGDAQALAEAMQKMKTNEEAYRYFRKEAEKRSDFFGYERYRDRIREVFGTGREKTPRE
jgi:glycosyltransferase involved in cell wall biosynthesis